MKPTSKRESLYFSDLLWTRVEARSKSGRIWRRFLKKMIRRARRREWRSKGEQQ